MPPIQHYEGIMKKIFLFFICIFFMSVTVVFAVRNLATTTTYESSTLIKTGAGLIYYVDFVAKSNGGDYILYDAIAPTGGSGSDLSEIKSEGSEVTALGSHFKNYSEKPLRFRTGLYLSVNDGYVTVSYE